MLLLWCQLTYFTSVIVERKFGKNIFTNGCFVEQKFWNEIYKFVIYVQILVLQELEKGNFRCSGLKCVAFSLIIL